MNGNSISNRRLQRGVTLIELMIVLVIISIVAALAYPSYTQYVTRAKRSAAQSMLLQVADRQQQFFMDNKRYAASMTDLGFPANPFSVGSEGEFVASGSKDAIYRLEFAATTATTYTVQAVPLEGQAKLDTKCGTLSYDETGTKAAGGSVADCW